MIVEVTGAPSPCLAMVTFTVVPTLPLIESDTLPVVHPSVLISLTPIILSPTIKPDRSAGVDLKTAVIVMDSFNWVICTPIPA